MNGVRGAAALSVRTRSQGSSFRKRVITSNVAPPPDLKGVEANVVKHLDDFKNVVRAHSCGEDGLVTVPQRNVCNPDGRRVSGESVCAVAGHRLLLREAGDLPWRRNGKLGRVRPVA